MRGLLGPNTVTGYCTNVHPGDTYAALLHNLRTHAAAVKQRVSPGRPMGVGLWIPAGAACAIRRDGLAAELSCVMGQLGLLPYTINGFPYGNFHEPVVKQRVYLPDWAAGERLRYTTDLADILVALLPDDAVEGSISTLPLCWAHPRAPAGDRMERMAGNLAAAARHLCEVEQRTGKLVHLDLEPEPGCALQRSGDVVDLFERHLDRCDDREIVRRYVRVCHDVCHAAVMFEGQGEALANYRGAGIGVGKVQVSSAVEAVCSAGAPREMVRGDLRRLVEPRYLHQTVLKRADGAVRFFEDLPLALDAVGDRGDVWWRVHLHVPLFQERFGALGTTRGCVEECLAAIRPEDGVGHFEIETYAWHVLPPGLRGGSLADDVAKEFEWLGGLVDREGAG